MDPLVAAASVVALEEEELWLVAMDARSTFPTFVTKPLPLFYNCVDKHVNIHALATLHRRMAGS